MSKPAKSPVSRLMAYVTRRHKAQFSFVVICILASAVASLTEIFPAMADQISALASASETISGIDGIYMAIFIGVPLCKWLYKKLEPTLGRVTKAGRRAAEDAAQKQ